jgi:hypothetical protein
MNITFSRGIGLLSMMLLSLAIMAAPPSAKYSGVFDIRDAQVGEKEVTLTLDLRVTNMSPTPITDGVLRFEDPLAPPALLGTLSGVTCESGESVTLEGTITIPLREYEHWRRGGLPRAFVGSGVAREDESSATTPPENRTSSLVEIQELPDAPATGSPAVFERVELRWDPREFEVAP